jgi:hypothetical protein
MKSLCWSLAFFVVVLAGCSYTDGQCWSLAEENGQGGAAGGSLVPSGAGGDYGEAPPKPLGAGNPAPPNCIAMGSFSSSSFKFKTTVEDDPSAPAGGWQEARPTLSIVDLRQDPPAKWTCTFTFGIPLRTVAHRKISAGDAADIAAEVATLGSGIAMPKKEVWVPADFCNQFRTDMNQLLTNAKSPYKDYGARVNN